MSSFKDHRKINIRVLRPMSERVEVRIVPNLRRTALRNGGVLHASTRAEPRSGLGLNELLGPTALMHAEEGSCSAQPGSLVMAKKQWFAGEHRCGCSCYPQLSECLLHRIPPKL